jgi:CheY-like chemotaxis protein
MPTARILLVDDEPALLRLMQTYLDRLGYETAAVENGAEAMAVFKRDPAFWDVLVADLSLPDTSGDQLALSMFRASPRLRVLLCSGYPFEIESLPPEAQPAFAQLQKPFLPAMLAQSIEELIARKV